MEEARTQARKENEAYEEELHRKAEEAREFKESWERSQWSDHVLESKESFYSACRNVIMKKKNTLTVKKSNFFKKFQY